MKKLSLAIFILLSGSLKAQPGAKVFNDTLVHSLVIESGLPNWLDSLDADYKANSQILGHPQKYFKCRVIFDGVELKDCGFKEKGNASNWFTHLSKKKPLKIAFNEFNENQTLDGLKKINLNNFTNDPSLLHDVICFKLMRDVVGVAPRTSFAKVWIDGEFIGLYLIIENVDKTFLKMHYGGGAKNDGNLYKTDRNAQMFFNWLGSDASAYKQKNFTLNTNEKKDDWSRFIDFVHFLNFNQDPDFQQQLEARFDVHAYLKILAVEKLTKSWDSYWGGGNNFFIYEHPDGKIRWIPWDMNETFQEIRALSGTSFLEGYLVPTPQLDERPLIKRIFEHEEWKQEYFDNVCALVNGEFTLDHLGKYILDRHRLADSAYNADPYKYNSHESFRRSLTESNTDLVSLGKAGNAFRIRYPGLYPVIEDQRKWAVAQLHAWDYQCAIRKGVNYDLKIFPNPASELVHIANEGRAFEYADIRIYDMQGKRCYSSGFQLMSGAAHSLALHALPEGIYLLLKISADGSIGKAKLVVSR